MSARSELLDAAKKVCLSDSAIARKLHVHRATVSGWRTGKAPMPDDHIIEVAKIAGENPAFWLNAISAEQSVGAVRRAWEMGAAALPRVAVLALVVGGVFAQIPAGAQNLNEWQTKHYAKLTVLCFHGLTASNAAFNLARAGSVSV